MINHKRTDSGQAMISLGLVISVFVLLVIGFYSFEINRLSMVRIQLRSACDAAALAGAATLASQNNTDPTAAQNAAIATALNTFQQNSILGVPLSNAYQAMDSGDQPASGAASIYVQLLDPNNNDQAVPLGDPNGKIISITGAFGDKPIFASMLGISDTPVYATSTSGVPSMDVVLCFDVSASIDDQTPVTFVRRQWNPAQGKTNYNIASTSAGSPAGALAEGTIYNILGPQPIGSAVDGVFPQSLDETSVSGETGYYLYFSEVSGTTGSAVGLRGSPNTGTPPGNYPPGSAGTGKPQTYTDLVVNIDGNTTFGGITANGFAFPDIGTVVEAARGNLENTTVFKNSKANVSLSASITPKAGYQAEYFALAAQNSHPIYDAQQAAQIFLDIMNTNTDCHFGLVCFTSNAGTSTTTTYSMDNIDSAYGAGGTGNFACPDYSLSSTTGTTNYSQCGAALKTTGPISGTNIGDAVNTAVSQFTSGSRKGSKKAIVLFTDGEPTAGGPLNSDPDTNARMAAQAAAKVGIPVYCIGLAQNSAIIPSETAILTDTNSSPTAGGIAGIAGNGGKFFLVTNVADLQLTFENIARQLVQLVK